MSESYPNELIRFMVVRPPAQQDSKKVITILENYENSNIKSDLERLKQNNEREEMIHIAKKYLANTIIRDKTSLRTKIFDVSKSILSTKDPIEEIKTINGIIKSITGKEIEGLLNSSEYQEDKTHIFDNYIAMKISNQTSIIHKRKGLAQVIRIINLLEFIKHDYVSIISPPANRSLTEKERKENQLAIQELITQKISLPSKIFPLPPFVQKIKNQAVTHNENQKRKIKDVKEKIKTLEDTLKDLIGIYHEQHEEDLKTPSTSEIISMNDGRGGKIEYVLDASKYEPKSKFFKTAKIAGLKKESREILKALKIPENAANIETSCNKIESQISKEYEKLYSLSNYFQKGVTRGNLTVPINIGHNILDSGTDILEDLSNNNSSQDLELINSAAGYAKIWGIGDLEVVKEKTVSYLPGEIAHIENVLAGENRKRTHRRLKRTDEFISTFIEKEEESHRDLESTEQYSLQKESSSILKSDSHLEAGIDATYNYGKVLTINANASGSVDKSKEQSEKTASNFTRSITERASSLIREKIREGRSKRIIEEVEEYNEHGIDNSTKPHQIGIYRWIDKIHEIKIFNYGKRLMMEFMVPRPGAFLLHFLKHQTPNGISLEDPGDFNLHPSEISAHNYKHYMVLYRASDLKQPPPCITYESDKIKLEGDTQNYGEGAGKPVSSVGETVIKIPEGYIAKNAYIAFSTDMRQYFSGNFPNETFSINIGGQTRTSFANYPQLRNDGTPKIPLITQELEDNTGELQIAIRGYIHHPIIISIEIECERTNRSLERWQIDTYEKIHQGYLNLKSIYEEQLAASAIDAGIAIRGRNPLENRKIENVELQKSCISILTGQQFESFNGIIEAGDKKLEYPEIDFDTSKEEAGYIKFFQQSFEWNNVTYSLYPYFWTNKEKWVDLLGIEDTDTIHANFLKASYARVAVPVRPTFECAMLNYITTGQKVWDLEPLKISDEESYDIPEKVEDCESASPGNISVLDEKLEQDGADFTEIPFDKSTEITIPTSLVILQEEPHLPNRKNETWNKIMKDESDTE